MGHNTSEKFSPERLKVSTLSDEVRVNNGGLGYVYSIAADAQMAVLLAGHAANSAFWIDDATGKWASSSFYKEQPQCVGNRNHTSPLSVRMDTMSWEPAISLDLYPDIPEVKRFYKFRYIFPQSSVDRFRMYKESALVNEEITTVAIDHIRSMSLGKRGQTDMVNLGFTAAPYSYANDADNRIELMDTYIRLDRQLARLFDYLDKNVGMENVVVMLSGTGHFAGDAKPDPKFKIPGGDFYADRATSLLNMFLMAKYGNGQWVIGFCNRQFFLNREYAKEINVDMAEMRAEAAQFVRQMSGVAAAYTYEEILRNPTDDQLLALHRSMQPDIEGDIIVQTAPGWSIQEQLRNGKTKTTNIRANAICTPAFIMAPSVTAKRVSSPVKAVLLAPTMARALHIRSPNAASASPLAL
ncbi:MAG: alkaline phosphatase family protein [Bacteroidaceae bacterium]|nr:alkaline phosphatase family protein [Bacteroidaceae bacterium]